MHKIKVEQFGDSAGSEEGGLTYARSGDWKFQLDSFKTGVGVSRIKVILKSTESASQAVGKLYFDDIKIMPALNSRVNWYAPQSCRLYPEDDSLSCQYFDDSGIIRKGWPGYCLEYDREPGSPNACLLWWPVDKVKGDGIEEGGGYTDKLPLYYCTDFQTGVIKGKFGCANCMKQDMADTGGCTCDPIYSSGAVSIGAGNEMRIIDSSCGNYVIKIKVDNDLNWYDAFSGAVNGEVSFSVPQGGSNQVSTSTD